MIRRKKLAVKRNRSSQQMESQKESDAEELTPQQEAIDSDIQRLEGDDSPMEEDYGDCGQEPEVVEDMDEELNVEDGQFIDVETVEGFDEHFETEVREDIESGDDDSGDDVWDDDKIPDPRSDSEDEFWTDYGQPFSCSNERDKILQLGQIFNNVDEFKDALLRYSLKTQYNIVMYKSSSDRLGAKCTKSEAEKCPWRCYCSFEKMKNKLMVKVFVDEHVCVRSGYTKLLKGSTIAQLYEERLRLNPKIRPDDMVDEIKREYNMNVSAHQCKRAKTLVVQKRKASHEAHFARIWDYKGEILRSNRGSTVDIETIPGPIPDELPNAEHRMCARHVLERWKKTNKDIVLERLFWRIARSYTIQSFEDSLEELKKYNQSAFESLQRTSPISWSRAFFKIGSFCNDNLNNLSESFNRNIREARRLPIIDFLTEVRRKTMERNAKRTLLTNKWKKRFTPKEDKEIEINRQKARDCRRYTTTGNLHEIDYHGDAYCVDMVAKTCGCGYWQMNGIPCLHAMCVITTTKLDLNRYVSDYYLTTKWRQLYAQGIKPVQGMKLWQRTGRLPVLPPPIRNNKGRPSVHARRKGPEESSTNPNKLTRHGRVSTCSNCRIEGHNKSRCPNPASAPQARRPRGRPRKEQGQSSQQGSHVTPSSSQQWSEAQVSSSQQEWPSWPF